MVNSVDWKEIFKKYVTHVCDCEGTAFLDGDYDRRTAGFTPEEWAAIDEVQEVLAVELGWWYPTPKDPSE